MLLKGYRRRMENPRELETAKPHLVLVHSFYANSILLHGLGEFLSRRIRGPFHRPARLRGPRAADARRSAWTASPATSNGRVRALGLDDYHPRRISFGFTVVCRMPCRPTAAASGHLPVPRRAIPGPAAPQEALLPGGRKRHRHFAASAAAIWNTRALRTLRLLVELLPARRGSASSWTTWTAGRSSPRPASS